MVGVDTEQCQSPATCVADAAELGQEVDEFLACADRAPAHERDPGDDLVCEEALAGRREEIVLVAAQAEEGEAVLPVTADEAARGPPLVRRLPDAVGDGAQPEVERARSKDEREPNQRVLPAVALIAAQLEQRRQCDERCDGRRGCEQRLDRTRVAGDVEAAAETHERDEQGEPEGRLLDVEPLGDVRERDPDDEHDGELPGAPASAREQTREPHEAEPEREREDARGARHAGGQHSAHEVGTVRELWRERRDDPDESDNRRGNAEHLFAAEEPQRHAATVPPKNGRGRKGPLVCLAPAGRLKWASPSRRGAGAAAGSPRGGCDARAARPGARARPTPHG